MKVKKSSSKPTTNNKFELCFRPTATVVNPLSWENERWPHCVPEESEAPSKFPSSCHADVLSVKTKNELQLKTRWCQTTETHHDNWATPPSTGPSSSVTLVWRRCRLIQNQQENSFYFRFHTIYSLNSYWHASIILPSQNLSILIAPSCVLTL